MISEEAIHNLDTAAEELEAVGAINKELPEVPEHVGEADRAAGNVTVKALDLLAEKMALKEKEIEKVEEGLKKLKEELNVMEAKATAHLTELNRKDYDSPFGKMKVDNKWSVRMPENDLEKEKLWKWMREQGIFGKYATVNSNSLQSLFKSEKAKLEATDKEAAAFFTLPGLGAPELFRKLDFKIKKQSPGKG